MTWEVCAVPMGGPGRQQAVSLKEFHSQDAAIEYCLGLDMSGWNDAYVRPAPKTKKGRPKGPTVDYEARIKTAFDLIVAAAVAGERCPMNSPMGPLPDSSVSALVRRGWIRTELYQHNYRVAIIQHGEHNGKRTMPNPQGGMPYRVNGFYVP